MAGELRPEPVRWKVKIGKFIKEGVWRPKSRTGHGPVVSPESVLKKTVVVPGGVEPPRVEAETPPGLEVIHVSEPAEFETLIRKAHVASQMNAASSNVQALQEAHKTTAARLEQVRGADEELVSLIEGRRKGATSEERKQLAEIRRQQHALMDQIAHLNVAIMQAEKGLEPKKAQLAKLAKRPPPEDIQRRMKIAYTGKVPSSEELKRQTAELKAHLAAEREKFGLPKARVYTDEEIAELRKRSIKGSR